MSIYDIIYSDSKKFAVLIDPDKIAGKDVEAVSVSIQDNDVDIVLVGGGYLIETCIRRNKNRHRFPVIGPNIRLKNNTIYIPSRSCCHNEEKKRNRHEYPDNGFPFFLSL